MKHLTRRINLPNILAMIYTYISFFHFVSFLKDFPPPFSHLFVAMVKKTGYDSGLPSETWNYTVLRTQTSLQIAHEALLRDSRGAHFNQSKRKKRQADWTGRETRRY